MSKINMTTLMPPWRETPSIPEEIKEEVCKFHPDFHLFGSREKAVTRQQLEIVKESDWDFAFPYEGSEQLECEKAKSLGWIQKETGKYKDALHFITWEKKIGEHRVQMCSKINLAFFIDTFRLIDNTFYWKYLHKSSFDCLDKPMQTDIFNQMYRMRGW